MGSIYMGVNNRKESVIRQIEEFCKNNNDEKVNEVLQYIQQILSMVVADDKEIRKRLFESVEQSLNEYKPGFIIWLLEIFGFNKRLIQTIEERISKIDLTKATTTKNPDEMMMLIQDLTEQLKRARTENNIRAKEKECENDRIRLLEQQVHLLSAGYQKLLIKLHKPNHQESELESVILNTFEDIGAEVVWEKTEEDYGRLFRVINIPNDSRFLQDNMPCIKTKDQTLCQGVIYKIVGGEDK